jgi:hypothetical protein
VALVTRSATAGGDANTLRFAPQVSGDLIAGEALDAVAPCYIKISDGKVYMSNGTAATEPAKVHGFTARSYGIGQPVTLFGPGARLRLADSGLAIGALYVGATAGRLDTAATTGDATGVAFAINATDIVVGRYAF